MSACPVISFIRHSILRWNFTLIDDFFVSKFEDTRRHPKTFCTKRIILTLFPFWVFDSTQNQQGEMWKWHSFFKGVFSTSYTLVKVKAWPNTRNISMQHLATLLGTTYCVRLATLLRCVATCWMMLDQIWKRSNFSCNILDVAWCCTRLATFTQHCCARACALGPLARYHSKSSILIFGLHPSARGLGLINSDMWWMLRAFGQPVQ